MAQAQRRQVRGSEVAAEMWLYGVFAFPVFVLEVRRDAGAIVAQTNLGRAELAEGRLYEVGGG